MIGKILWGIVFLLILTALAWAGEVKHWELVNQEAFAKGEGFKNIILSSKGELILGYKLSSFKLPDETSIWSAIYYNGAIYAGTSSGTIYRIINNKAEKVFSTGQMLITSLLQIDGTIYAATIPNGKIFRMGPDGKWEEFIRLDCKYIWAMLVGKGDTLLWVATGTPGRLFKIGKNRDVQVAFETGTKNILCLAYDKDMNLYFGTSDKGHLFRFADNKARILYSFQEDEVKAIAVDKGVIYVGVNRGVDLPPPEFLKLIKQPPDRKEIKPEQPGSQNQPQPQKESEPAQKDQKTLGSEVWRISDVRVEKLISFPKSYITSILLIQDQLIVGTNNSGRLFGVGPDRSYQLLYDLPQNQVLGFIYKGQQLDSIFTGQTAAIHKVSPERAESGTYLSEAFDARFQTTWGNLSWKGEGRISFQTRSGHTKRPGLGWSEWTEPIYANPIKITSPKARYIQFKINFEGPSAKITAVTIAYKNENQRPKISNLEITDWFPPTVPGAPSQQPVKSPLPKHSTIKQLTWTATDEDGDRLLYRIYYRKLDWENWVLATPCPLQPTVLQYQWDVRSISDGKYIVRLEVSDELSNPTPERLTSHVDSVPIIIDNTAPTISFTIKETEVYGEVIDNVSNISRIEYILDHNEPVAVFPKDGLFDEKREEFIFKLKEVSKGLHTLTIRAFDRENNLGVAAKEFRIQ